MDCRVKPGNDERRKLFSRRASASEFCDNQPTNKNLLESAPGNQREAKRRKAHAVHCPRRHPDVATRMAGRGSASSGMRSPSGASPRHSPRQSQPATGFPAAGQGAVFYPPQAICRGLTRSAWTGPFAGRPVPQGRPGTDRIHPRAGTAPRSVLRKCPRERRPSVSKADHFPSIARHRCQDECHR